MERVLIQGEPLTKRVRIVLIICSSNKRSSFHSLPLFFFFFDKSPFKPAFLCYVRVDSKGHMSRVKRSSAVSIQWSRYSKTLVLSEELMSSPDAVFGSPPISTYNVHCSSITDYGQMNGTKLSSGTFTRGQIPRSLEVWRFRDKWTAHPLSESLLTPFSRALGIWGMSRANICYSLEFGCSAAIDWVLVKGAEG